MQAAAMLSPPDSNASEAVPPAAGVPKPAEADSASVEAPGLPTPPQSHVSPEPLSDSDTDADEDLEAPAWDGIRRRKRRPGARIRPSYYYPSGTMARGVPVFEPTMDEFADFNQYIARIDHYGMRSGIVKVVPPKEWLDTLPSVSEPLKRIRLRDPIAQHFIGSSGLYRVANVAKTRIWNPKQWKETSETERLAPPNFFERKTVPPPTAADPADVDFDPPTSEAQLEDMIIDLPTSEVPTEDVICQHPVSERIDAVDSDDVQMDAPRASTLPRPPVQATDSDIVTAVIKADSPTASAIAGSEAATPAAIDLDTSHELPTALSEVQVPAEVPQTADDAKAIRAKAAKKRGTPLSRADISDEAWTAWTDEWLKLPYDGAVEDYTVEACASIERNYWRTLTFGEPPMYGADMKGSIFTKATKSWNVANLEDLLTKLGRHQKIPGVNTPYLYFGMWRATFAWHVEDADLYSINYIHFGAPKFWYSVPQEQAERFERVMAGWFPQEQGKCRQFLRHKSFLASPRKLANEGISLNKVVQLPGEFILTYPYGYHSGFNGGYNCAESINFATDAWIEIGRKARPCACAEDSVNIDVDAWLQAADNPGSVAFARKRIGTDDGLPKAKKPRIATPIDPQKAALAARKAEREKAARLAAQRPPFVCALCPDMSTDTLVLLAKPLTTLSAEQHARRRAGAAHKACVMYVPSTFIDMDERDGEERVFGFEGIEKERWKLKCQLCDERYGCPVQCTKTDKCVRAQHVTCALKEDSGVILDAFLTNDGRETSLMASSDSPEVPLPCAPSIAAEGSVRLVVLCRAHNPAWQKAQQAAKTAKLAASVEAVPLGSRIAIKAAGSTFDVQLISNLRDAAAVDVLQDDGRRAVFKYTAISWPSAPKQPTRARSMFEDAYVFEHKASGGSRSRGDVRGTPTTAAPSAATPTMQPTLQPMTQPMHPILSTAPDSLPTHGLAVAVPLLLPNYGRPPVMDPASL